MTKGQKELLLEIARNDEIQNTFDQLKKRIEVNNSYSRIVKAQIDMGIKKMHLPEPWSGHLSKAKIMFISSNPSISIHDDFPTREWKDDDIINFFENRFSENENGISSYWKNIAKQVRWIYPECEQKSVVEILNENVVFTEVVHCKSKKEIGVRDCVDEESKYMSRIISEFKGEIIIIVGSVARDMYESKKFEIQSGTVKKIAIIPAPNARGYKDEERRKILLEQL